MEFKHLRLTEETHKKFLLAKGILATQGKNINLSTIADDLIDKFIKELHGKS